MKINVLMVPSLYVSDPEYQDAILTPYRYIDDVKHSSSMEQIICIFRCQHANITNDEDGIYCPECNNKDLSAVQIEELNDLYVAGLTDDYDYSDEARDR